MCSCLFSCLFLSFHFFFLQNDVNNECVCRREDFEQPRPCFCNIAYLSYWVKTHQKESVSNAKWLYKWHNLRLITTETWIQCRDSMQTTTGKCVVFLPWSLSHGNQILVLLRLFFDRMETQPGKWMTSASVVSSVLSFFIRLPSPSFIFWILAFTSCFTPWQVESLPHSSRNQNVCV